MSKSKKTSKNKEQEVKSPGGVSAGGDQMIEGGAISITNKGNKNVFAVGGGTVNVQYGGSSSPEINNWLTEIEKVIDAQPKLTPQDKTDLKEQSTKIAEEVKKGKKADQSRLERLVNVIGVMAPDIFDVVISSLAGPVAGLGMAFKKIGEKAKLISQAEAEKS